MNPFEPQFEDATPEGGQQQVGFNPTKTYDLSQEVLQEYERSEKSRSFYDKSIQERLKTSINNKQQGIQETKAYYEGLAPLMKFSSTAEKLVQTYVEDEKEKRKSQAQLDVLNRVWDTGATDEEKSSYQANADAAAGDREIRNAAADDATRETGNTDVASWINSSDPYTAQYRAEALAISAAADYKGWLSNALANNTDMLPEFGKPVNELRGPVERRAGISYLRGLYQTTSGMGILNPAVIDSKVFPTMKTAESTVLDSTLKSDRIEEGEQIRSSVLADVSEGSDIVNSLQRLANSTGANGKPTGYAEAYTLLKGRYSNLLATGQMTEEQIYAIEANTIDPVTNKPFSQARPTFAEDIVISANKIKAGLKKAEDFEIGAKADAYVEDRVQNLPDRMTAEEARQELLDFQNLYPGLAIPRALQQALNLRGPKAFADLARAEFDDKIRRGEAYTTDDVNDAFTYSDPNRQKFLAGASDYIENKADQDALETPEKDLEQLIIGDDTLYSGEKGVSAGGRAVIQELTAVMRAEYNRLRTANPEGNRASQAIEAQRFAEARYREGKEGRYRIEDGLAPELQQAVSPEIAKKYNLPTFDDLRRKTDQANSKNQDILTLKDPKDPNKTALGFTKEDLTNITSGNISAGNANRLKQLKEFYGQSPFELLQKQYEAFGMELPPPSPVAQQVSAAPQEAQDILMSRNGTPTTRNLSRAVAQTTGGQETYFPKAPMIDGEDSNIYIQESGQTYQQSPALIAALLWQENKFQKYGQSTAGAQGIAQIMPETAKQYGVNPNDWKASIQFVGQYLADIKSYLGTQDDILALAGYNWGMGNVGKAMDQLGEEQAIQWMLDPSRPRLPDGTRLPYETWEYIQNITKKAPTYGYGIARPGILRTNFLPLI